MKNLANYFSILRMVLCIILYFMTPLTIYFFLIYFLCGLTDILDGYVARRTNTQTALGDRLDTLGDMLFIFITILKLVPLINVTLEMTILFLIIISIKIFNIIFVYIKYNTFEILHLYSSKFTGLLLFIFPIILNSVYIYKYIFFMFLISLLSSLEEFIIHFTSKELNLNRKTIFNINKN